ncbi:MAG: phage tail protein [Anaerolineaceae bacterium]|nr:phage tail protein [Anaerolineaceae bacterium]
MQEIKLILVDPQPALCTAWRNYFAELPDVEIVNEYFEKLSEFDCMVSAANSFGLMDGGVDLAIVRFFGRNLEQRVQKHILETYLGEQPIGTSFIIETGHEKHPYIAHTPTMRIPMTIALTDNVYIAMWAMLLAVYQHNLTTAPKIRSIACPGLGTATGQVPYDEAARQMAVAYRNFLNPPRHISWRYADERQKAVGRGGDLGMMFSSIKK